MGHTVAVKAVTTTYGWRARVILEAETHNAEHPGKIADYAGAVDFFVDLRSNDQGFTVQVMAHSKFDA
jgi:hypothetical protein